MLTDFNIDFRDDETLKRVHAGCTLHALFKKDNIGLLPTKVVAVCMYMSLLSCMHTGILETVEAPGLQQSRTAACATGTH